MSFFDQGSPAQTNPYLTFGKIPAGFWRRVLATLIDGLAVAILSALIAKLISPSISLTNITAGAALYKSEILYTTIQLVISISYQIVLVGHAPGRTIGDYAAGIQVVSLEMGVPGYTRASKRVTIALVSSALSYTVVSPLGSLLFLIDGLWMLFDKNRQTIHDKIAGTYVIRYLRNAAVLDL